VTKYSSEVADEACSHLRDSPRMVIPLFILARKALCKGNTNLVMAIVKRVLVLPPRWHRL